MEKEKLEVDVDKVLRAKMPRYRKFIPNFLVRALARTIHQDELNEILEHHGHKDAVEFSIGALKDLDIKLEIKGEENIPTDRRNVVFVSNHPLGGLDGIALIEILGKRYNGNIRFLVNDILMVIPPYADIFLPVNKHGKQHRENAKLINDAYASENVIATFPAGLCSRMGKGGEIKDLQWKKGFVAKSIEYQRDVVPIFFEGHNSMFFYRFAKMRKKLGLKFNIEMIYLPSEVFKNRGSKFTVHFGKPISWKEFVGKSHQKCADEVKEIVYNLRNK